VAIEGIKAGDRVLSQHIETGEISFSPVQGTTLRAPSPTLKISTGGDTLLATAGHPLWVIGKGWQTAKHLHLGDLLHGLNGPAMIDHLEEARPVEVYNLIVSDHHNYFAGDAQLLVHDNSPLEPDIAQLPGLLRAVETRQAANR
jgi:hypothetical protein